jgi:hypothetical protein
MRVARHTLGAAFLASFVLALSSGCGAVGQNVRAYRAYAHEDVSLRVSLDRIEDIAKATQLVDRILLGQPYTPGDTWVRRLPLTDGEARALRDGFKGKNPYNTGEFEVPILKLYRAHVEGVLDEYAPPPEKAKYPCILDAVQGLVPRTPLLKQHWVAHRDAIDVLQEATEEEARITEEIGGLDEASRQKRQPEITAAHQKTLDAQAAVDASKRDIEADAQLLAADAQLGDEGRKQVAREGLTVLSVAFRMELEALALVPIVAIQTIRAIPGAPRDMIAHPTGKMARQIWRLPQYISGIKERMTRQVVILEGMTNVLCKALKTEVDESPGFVLRESIVDQIVGITLDSFRVDLRAGGEAFMFNAVPQAERSSTNDGKTTYDYTGRTHKLEYTVQPIVMANARLDVTLDWIQLPGAASLGFAYTTDRAWKSGGSIETTSLSKALGIKGVYSDALEFGLGFLGVRSGAKFAHFTTGEAREVDVASGAVMNRAPLRLDYMQIDVGYDILFALADEKIKAWTEELVVGFRYLKYTLPRIIYQLQDTATADQAANGEQHFTFAGESDVQNVDARYYMLGFDARIGQGEAPRFSPFLDVSLRGGAGPASFYTVDKATSTRTDQKQVAWVVNGGLGAGVRWRLLPRGSRLRLDLRAMYRADVIYASISKVVDTSGGPATRTDFGGVDVFHGPTLAIRGSF